MTNSHCTHTQGVVDNTEYHQPIRPINPWDMSNRVGLEIADPPFFTGGNCPSGYRCRYSDSAFVRSPHPSGPSVTLNRGYIARLVSIDWNGRDLYRIISEVENVHEGEKLLTWLGGHRAGKLLECAEEEKKEAVSTAALETVSTFSSTPNLVITLQTPSAEMEQRIHQLEEDKRRGYENVDAFVSGELLGRKPRRARRTAESASHYSRRRIDPPLREDLIGHLVFRSGRVACCLLDVLVGKWLLRGKQSEQNLLPGLVPLPCFRSIFNRWYIVLIQVDIQQVEEGPACLEANSTRIDVAMENLVHRRQ